MTRHHHPAQALGATGGLAALVGWVPTAVSARSVYKVKGEVPEGLLRRRAQEETEREAVVKVSYTRKEARRLSRRESRPVLSHSAWSLRCPDWNRPLECHWYRRPKA
jgi:hypothetical protein